MLIQNGKILITLVVPLCNFWWNLVPVMNSSLVCSVLFRLHKIDVTYGMSLLAITGDPVWSQYFGYFWQRECSENQGFRKPVPFSVTFVNLSQAAHGVCPFHKGRGNWTKCNSGPTTQSSSVEEEIFASTSPYFFWFCLLDVVFSQNLKNCIPLKTPLEYQLWEEILFYC